MEKFLGRHTGDFRFAMDNRYIYGRNDVVYLLYVSQRNSELSNL